MNKYTKQQQKKIQSIKTYLEQEAKDRGQKLTKFELKDMNFCVEIIATIGKHIFTKSTYQIFIGKRGAVRKAYKRTFSKEYNYTKLLNSNLYFLIRALK